MSDAFSDMYKYYCPYHGAHEGTTVCPKCTEEWLTYLKKGKK